MRLPDEEDANLQGPRALVQEEHQPISDELQTGGRPRTMILFTYHQSVNIEGYMNV